MLNKSNSHALFSYFDEAKQECDVTMVLIYIIRMFFFLYDFFIYCIK